LALAALLALPAAAQPELLQSGPMVGYSAMREVMLWVQTNQPASVQIEYWEEGKPEERFRTEAVQTAAADAYAAHLRADRVEPGRRYAYSLLINGQPVPRPYPLAFQTQALWQWRTDPPAFRFAFGSCNYINEDPYERPSGYYGGGYEVFGSIIAKKPDFMLWGGDNVYLREVDWDSETGIMRRYTHTRSMPELQALLGNVHHYAIWDDHDYGPNNSDRSFWHKHLTERAFKLFWANPNYGVANGGQGIGGTFHWADAQFFLLDNRYFRSPNERSTGERQLIGPEQEAWLIDALKNSLSPFKFVVIGGQFLNPTADKENHARYGAERERIIRAIRAERIEGVVFLTGDRHHTVLSMLQENPDFYPLYDFTVSPLTSGTHAPGKENVLLQEGTLVVERNFATLEVTGPRTDRALTVAIFDVNGKQLWTRTVKASELRYGKP
jgi:alkaline phosphatase D